MALTTAQYRNHVLLALKSCVTADPRLLLPLLPGLHTYARIGANEREAMEILLSWCQQHLLPGAFDGHRLKHLLAENGVPIHLAQDIVERAEP